MITQQDILESPAWYPLQQTADSVVLLNLDEAAYTAASFLDQRIAKPEVAKVRCQIDVMKRATAKLVPKAHFIFHTGHVGSTLISRLLGEHEQLFCLREPAMLRTFGPDGLRTSTPPSKDGLDLSQTLALLSRTWRKGQRAVIKVTSFVSELAGEILSLDDQAVALFLFTDPLTYLRTILAGPNSRIESRTLAAVRLRRLRQRLGEGAWPMDPVSEGEVAAMAWLCEMTALCEAAANYGGRITWVNFEAFLAAPVAGLDSMLHSLGVNSPAVEVNRLITGPLMQQYSKAPEYAYDAALRRRVLESASREHPGEIRRGMAWLDRVARRNRPVMEAFSRSSPC